MTIEEFRLTDYNNEKRYAKVEEIIAQEIIKEYLLFYPFALNQNQQTINKMQSLFEYYHDAKLCGSTVVFDSLLKKNRFNYSLSIKTAIFALLNNFLDYNQIRAINYPGVYDIKKEGSLYTLDTCLGKLKVYKASEEIDSYILKQQLSRLCYQRSYEFMKQNQEYEAILSYIQNFFIGGHFHVYLKNNEQVLDIASNALYEDLLSASKILNGQTLAQKNYEEAMEEISDLCVLVPKLRFLPPLKSLSLYYKMKNSKE